MTSRNNQNHMLTDHELHDLLKAERELDMSAAAKDEMRSQSDRAGPSDNSDDSPRNELGSNR